jgi:hypothetical protein
VVTHPVHVDEVDDDDELAVQRIRGEVDQRDAPELDVALRDETEAEEGKDSLVRTRVGRGGVAFDARRDRAGNDAGTGRRRTVKGIVTSCYEEASTALV